MNNNIKENEKNIDNMDRNKNLEQYSSFFCKIISEDDNLIKNNGYEAIKFYAIILCYFNYYDYN